jgi:hypothetical protein
LCPFNVALNIWVNNIASVLFQSLDLCHQMELLYFQNSIEKSVATVVWWICYFLLQPKEFCDKLGGTFNGNNECILTPMGGEADGKDGVSTLFQES